MRTLISIDGGMSTGISVGTYSDTEPYRLTHSFQFGGGVEGFIERVNYKYHSDSYFLTISWPEYREGRQLFAFFDSNWDHVSDRDDIEVIAEKFTARGGGQGFSLRTEHLEPLRVEGAMLAMGLNPHWVSPPKQYFAGGKTKAEKKKAQHRWLKDHGLYVTGKMVDSPDADDVRSSIAHAIAWLVSQRHKPTIEYYFKDKIG